MKENFLLEEISKLILLSDKLIARFDLQSADKKVFWIKVKSFELEKVDKSNKILTKKLQQSKVEFYKMT